MRISMLTLLVRRGGSYETMTSDLAVAKNEDGYDLSPI